MFFKVSRLNYLAKDFIKTDMYINACFSISNYPFRAAENSLDLFLKQNYRIGLRDMCFNLVTRLTINQAENGELVLLFNDPEDDLIARLITYGNGVVPGSQILKVSLNQK